MPAVVVQSKKLENGLPMFSAATPLTIFKVTSPSNTLPCKIVRVPVGEKISYASKVQH